MPAGPDFVAKEPSTTDTIPTQPLAIVGLSAIFPGSTHIARFWDTIAFGADRITSVPSSHWLLEDYFDSDPSAEDKVYANRGGFLSKLRFDPVAWGIPPATLEATDTSQLLALIAARRVLEDALGASVAQSALERTSVILGVTSAQELFGHMVSRLQRPIWKQALLDMGMDGQSAERACQRIADHYVPWQENTFPGLLGNVVAGRIANRLGLGGTNCVIDAACASTLSALRMAAQELWVGDSDMVICGGVDTMNDILMHMCFSKTTALSHKGDCTPFDAQADGTLLGEGLGLLALKRLEDAQRDGDAIYACLHGIGASSDGRSKSIYAPLSSGQAKAIRRCYQQAGYTPSTVTLMEAHGTGTAAGDVAEFKGLTEVFGTEIEHTESPCQLGSIKAQIGHTKAAAGAAGLIKAVLSLHQKTLPPTLKVQTPNPALDIEHSPFILNPKARPWLSHPHHPRRASVSAFGFGGANYHCTLSEPPQQTQRPERHRSWSQEIFAFSADDLGALLEKIQQAQQKYTSVVSADQVESDPIQIAQAFCHHSLQHFDADAPYRLTGIASFEIAAAKTSLAQSLERALTLTRKAIDASTQEQHSKLWQDRDLFLCGPALNKETKLGFIFSGQGSQYLDMGAPALMHFDAAMHTWDALITSTELNPQRTAFAHTLAQICFSATDDAQKRAEQSETLKQTQWAQPALAMTSMATLNILRTLGVQPDAVAGHSFGELCALHAAGGFDAAQLLSLAQARGQAMADAATQPGSMLAFSATREQVQALLSAAAAHLDKDLAQSLVIANHNAPKQTVVSGHSDAIEQLQRMVKERVLADKAIRCTLLSVSTAFHSPIVASAATQFAQDLRSVEWGALSVPVYSCMTAEPYPTQNSQTSEPWSQTLSEQIANPVRYVDTIQAMLSDGVQLFLEVGPSSVLTSLTQRIVDAQAEKTKDAVYVLATDRKGCTELASGLRAFTQSVATLMALGQVSNPLGWWQGYKKPSSTLLEKPKAGFTVAIDGTNLNKPYPRPVNDQGLQPKPKHVEPKYKTKNDIKMARSGDARQQDASSPLPSTLHGAPTMTQTTRENATPQHTVVQDQPKPQHVAEVSSAHRTSAPSAATLQTISSLQASAAQVHQSFQQQMSQAHERFLQTTAQALQALTSSTSSTVSIESQEPALNGALSHTSQFAPVGISHHVAPTSAVDPKTSSPAPTRHPAPSAAHVSNGIAIPTPQPAKSNGQVPASVTSVAPTPVKSSATTQNEGFDISTLLKIIAEKTGYPTSALTPAQSLESDLGIDSIKRVEILASLKEEVPALPELDSEHLSRLETIQDIFNALKPPMNESAVRPQSADAHTSIPAAPQPGPRAVNTSNGTASTQSVLLSVIAEKTGYPIEALQPEMSLESDLGIDSIKRVEILSALQEQGYINGQFSNEELAQLQTIQALADRLSHQSADKKKSPMNQSEHTTQP